MPSDNEIPTTSANQFEVDAFDILDKAPDYNTGVNQLVDYYSNNKFEDPAKARDLLSDYGNELRFKFKDTPANLGNITDIAPVKPEEAEGEDPVARINNWEKRNLEAISGSDDPDYIVSNKALKQTVSDYASEARRDELGGRGEGKIAWISDKFYRAAEGAVGPFAKLLGEDEVDKALVERTDRARDEGVAGKIANLTGAIIPAVAASLITEGAALPVIGTQALGEAKGTVNEALTRTGNAGNAITAGAVTLGAQALGVLPAASLASKLTGKALGREAGTVTDAIISSLDSQKQTFGNIAASTIATGALGSAGQVLGNVANNIALDENGDITHGAAEAFIANAIVGGAITSAHAFMQNASIEQLKGTINDAKNKVEIPKTDIQRKEEQVSPRVVKDSSGNIILEDAEPSFENRKAEKEVFDSAFQDYVNEPVEDISPRPSIETGEEANIPSYEDYDSTSIPAKAVMIGEPAVPPSRFVTYIASKLGAKFALSRNIADGAFGQFNPKTNTVRVLRSLGADSKQFTNTLAHEIGHFVDGYLNKAFTKSGLLQDVATKLSDTLGFVKDIFSDERLHESAKELSKNWRSGWDGTEVKDVAGIKDTRDQFNYYRSRPHELYADVFSALVNAPDWVRQNHSDIYYAFELSLSRSPELNSFWNSLREFERDPGKLSAFNMQVAGESRKEQGDIEAAVRLNKIKTNTIGARLKKNLDLAYRFLFRAETPVRNIANKLSGTAKDIAFDDIQALQSRGYSFAFINREIEKPLQNLLLKFSQTEIEPNTWAHYAWIDRMLNESTPTINRMKENPETYKRAAALIGKFLLNEKGVKSTLVERYFSDLDSPKGLERAFSSLRILGDTSTLLSLNDFLQKYDPKDPRRNIKAMRDYQLAVARLNQRKESIPIEKLKKYVKNVSPKEVGTDVKEALLDVTKDSAFAIRRLLINAGGYDEMQAKADLSHIQQTLGPEKFKSLQNIHSEYHSILAKVIPSIEKSQILSPDLLERFKLNADNYVMANVLKYFEGEDSINAGIRTSIGSMNELGNELTSTVVKTEKMLVRAYNQIAKNAATRLAEADGQLVETIKSDPSKNIFDLRDKLSKEDKDHSYIINYKKGVPEISKISGGKSYEDMFTSVRDHPVFGAVLSLSDEFNKLFLTRQFKTVLSPAFVLNQKFYDRQIEATIASAFSTLPGTAFHLGKLREIDKSTIEEINHFKQTGELTGALKKTIDLNAAVLQLHQAYENQVNSDISAADAITEMFGTKLPEEKSQLEKFGLYTEKALDKIGGAWLKELAEKDELRTKVNGFRIGKELLGMTDAEAAILAREKFGIPDPLGGGIGAPLLSRAFIFGRAHLNGLRVLGQLVKENPKGTSLQIGYRVLLPKLLVSSAVMGAVVSSVLGDDAGETYKLCINKIPEFDKISRTCIPLGFQDGAGNFHNMFDVGPGDVQADWKAWYVRLPQARELTTVSKMLWPMITELYSGKPVTGFQKGAMGGLTDAVAGIQPAIQYMTNIAQLTLGYNPTDFYRNKGILSKNVIEGGSLGDKFYDYAKYLGASQYPSAIPYNPFRTSEPVGALEKTITSVPFAGPLARAVVGVSNYGDIESGKEAETANMQLKAQIALSTDNTTQELLKKYATAAARTTSLGKGWQAKVGSEVAGQTKLLTSWHSKVWVPLSNELRAASEAGDDERYRELLKVLEDSSQSISGELKDLASEKVEESDKAK